MAVTHQPHDAVGTESKASIGCLDTSEALMQHALLLIARQHGGDVETAQQAAQTLAQWQQQSPAHEAAARAAKQAWQFTDVSHLQGIVERPKTNATRRSLLRALPLFATAGLGAVMGYRYWQQPSFQLTLQTEQGQLLRQTLPDGTELDLAANTQLQVVFYRNRREIHLQRGEARFDVARQGQAFEVYSRWGSIRVLGTSFSVTARATSTTVRVASGQVAVWQHAQAWQASDVEGTFAEAESRLQAVEPLHHRQRMETAEPDAMLHAGQGITLRQEGVEAMRSVDKAEVGAWRKGWLVFDDTPIAEAIANWNDYLRQPIEVADDSALAALRITGSFPLPDPASFLSSLPRILPVCVHRMPDGRQRVQAQCKG